MKTARLAAAAGAMLAMTLGAPALAQAAPQEHYYIEIGGTWDPDASQNYALANKNLAPGQAVPVSYPASPGPGLPGGLPSYNDSVHQGWINAGAKLRETYAKHPGAHFTVVGYSQGAHVANLVLNDVADGRINIPKSQVDGKLYADPMQPGTSIGALVPPGPSAFGFTSPGRWCCSPSRMDCSSPASTPTACVTSPPACRRPAATSPSTPATRAPRFPAR